VGVLQYSDLAIRFALRTHAENKPGQVCNLQLLSWRGGAAALACCRAKRNEDSGDMVGQAMRSSMSRMEPRWPSALVR
jgi:hypothetical protein